MVDVAQIGFGLSDWILITERYECSVNKRYGHFDGDILKLTNVNLSMSHFLKMYINMT